MTAKTNAFGRPHAWPDPPKAPPPPPAQASTHALDGEEQRVRVRIRDLRSLVDGLALLLDDPAPPGPGAGQAVAHAASDLAAWVARLDVLRRGHQAHAERGGRTR